MSKILLANIKGPTGDVTPAATAARVAAESAASAADADRVAAEAASDAADAAKVAAEAAAASVPSIPGTITDAVQEWWLYPLVTQLSDPYPRAVFGGIAADGTIVACEFDYATQTTLRVPVGVAGVDDHNAPALWIESGHRAVIAWQNHFVDNILRVRIGSRSGEIRDWLPQLDFDLGVGVSYAQIHRIESLSTATADVFWVLYRRGTAAWGIVTLTVNVANGAASISNNRSIISATEQAYVTSAPANDGETIRLAFGYNPAATKHAIHYLELDTETGAFSSPFTAGITGNYVTGVGLPIVDTTLTPAVAEPAAGNSRRLFYTRPGPDGIGLTYADWAIATPDQATYKQLRQTPATDAFNGLNMPIGSNVTAAYSSTLNQPQEFTYETAFQASAAPATNLYIAWRWNASSSTLGEQLWRSLIQADRKLKFEWRDNTNTLRANTTVAALPGAWTDPIGVRIKFDHDGGTTQPSLIVSYTLNPLATTPTWTALETLPLGTGQIPMATGIHPLHIGWTTASAAAPRIVFYAKMTDSTGAVVAHAPFTTTWPSGASNFTDSTGRAWTITGDAAVGHDTPSWSTDSFGIAGPRVGYNAEANYLAGMGYPNPSYDGTVLLARRNAGDTSSTVEEWRLSGDTYVGRTLVTSAEKLARPAPPRFGGPSPALYSEITRYDGYTSYDGNIKRAPR